MDYDQIVERIYEHIENDYAEKAVMACLRLARHTQDYLNAAVFLRELYPNKEEFSRVFNEDTVKLKEEAKSYLLKQSLEIWLAGRATSSNLSDDENQKFFVLGAGQMDAELIQLEKAIQDMVVPPGMSPFDTAAFTDSFARTKQQFRLRINALQSIQQRIKTRCLNYAISKERQLEAQREPELFLQRVQTDVNNYFKARSEDVSTKLQKAAQLVNSNDPEDYSVLLTQVRRAMKAVADHFYPPSPGFIICSDGTERKLGEEQYLNRLQEFLTKTFPASTATELLSAELNLLMVFGKRLNDISSKGVHASVSAEEAKQGLVGFYLFLYNIISKLEKKASDDSNKTSFMLQ